MPHIHYDLKSIQFHLDPDGIRCLVTFDSSRPELTGGSAQRQFTPDMTIVDILEEVDTFPTWIELLTEDAATAA